MRTRLDLHRFVRVKERDKSVEVREENRAGRNEHNEGLVVMKMGGRGQGGAPRLIYLAAYAQPGPAQSRSLFGQVTHSERSPPWP